MKQLLLLVVFLLGVLAVIVTPQWFLIAQEKPPYERPTIASIKLMPSQPIVVAGCVPGHVGGYLRVFPDSPREELGPSFSAGGVIDYQDPDDAAVGRYVKAQLKKGIMVTFYPDKGGIFVTSECQK